MRIQQLATNVDLKVKTTMTKAKDYTTVTELEGQKISIEQLERMKMRYHWASSLCANQDVLELACGGGQGLGIIAKNANSVIASDVSEEVLVSARRNFSEEFKIQAFSADAIPYSDDSFDVVILFEALYYLADFSDFIDECRRVLRPKGRLLLSMPNKDLYDFVPSPFSTKYYNIQELKALLESRNFRCNFYGCISQDKVEIRQKVMRPLKAVAAKLGLMPKSMLGKTLLKKIFFGGLTSMPVDLRHEDGPMLSAYQINPDTEKQPQFKVILCNAQKED